MAEDNDTEQEQEEGKEAQGSNLKKITIIAAVGFLLVVGTVAGTLYFLGVFGDEEVVIEEVEEDQQPSHAPAIYYPIKPAFIINFRVRGRQRLLQIAVTVMTREVDAVDAVQTHLPLIKNKLVMLFGGEVYEDLHTAEGRELLRQKTLEAVQDVLQQEIGKPGIEQVLFEDFIMQ